MSLELETNELVGLIGPNGAGKTTLFNLLTGVYEPSQGEVVFYQHGNPVTLNGMKPYKVAKAGLSRTFQNIRLFKELTVMDNVLIAMNAKHQEGFFTSVLRLPKFYRAEAELRDESSRNGGINRLDS